ncbi:hypothetical protein J4G33_12240 [Actinotalea sp. BY-33]|uniref:Uncharacterized protein n=1 Tax=Actinotalea soli TaxID=2819234 RepID=A0A939RWF1_9CELL|nr:hypothetical protein [Actinotalea soli]MBO1752573.1 hypothetical protein [Actinotalea soli]
MQIGPAAGAHLVLRAHLAMRSGPPWRSPDDDAYVEPCAVDLGLPLLD